MTRARDLADGTFANDLTVDTDTLYVDSTNNRVGIGLVSPSRQLHIKGSASAVRLEDTDQAGVYHEIIENSGQLDIRADHGNTSTTGNMLLSTGGSEALRIDSSGYVGISTSSPQNELDVRGTVEIGNGSTQRMYLQGTGNDFRFYDRANLAERLRITSGGNVGIGVSSPAHPLSVENPDGNTNTISMINNSSNLSRLAFVQNGSTTAAYSSIDADGRSTGFIRFNTNDAEAMRIDSSGTVYFKDGGSSNPGIRFLNDTDLGIFRPSANTIAFTNGGSESVRIDSSGRLLVGTTDTSLFNNTSGNGFIYDAATGSTQMLREGNPVLFINRASNDGTLVTFVQNGSAEGSISVSGTTVTYGGGHLARWSRLSDDSKDTSIVKGTVMTNLDAMVEWGDEGNEQLNKTAVSSVEGDVNVAGVFVSWDDDDEWNDFYVAMTGDMIIRIAQGTTVARGDLLMSAGDGTAKPQGDDIVRSKTIAKVTSTNVSHTYDDGSYCVPCVLMAC